MKWVGIGLIVVGPLLIMSHLSDDILFEPVSLIVIVFVAIVALGTHGEWGKSGR